MMRVVAWLMLTVVGASLSAAPPMQAGKTSRSLAVVKTQGELKPAGIPNTHKSDAVTLPEPREVKGTTRMVSLSASTADPKAEVEWVVFNLADENPVEALSNGRTLLVFPNDQDDMIVVLCYVKRSTDGASSPVRTLIKVVSGRRPPDKKEPDKKDDKIVPPPPAAKVAHLSFVIDPARHTPDIAAVVNDRGLREKLATAGVRVHALTTASRSVVQRGLAAGVGKAGGVPCVILQDATGNIIDAAKLTDVASVLALVGRYQ